MSDFDKEEFLRKNHPQDVLWLSLLSEKELDVLILLKSLVIERAMYVGHEHVANRYVLKMLWELYCRVVEHLKGWIEDTPSISGTELLSGFNTSDLRHTNNFDFALLGEVITPIRAEKGNNSSRATSNDLSSTSRILIQRPRKIIPNLSYMK